MSNNLLLTAICPHPPIIIDEVGGRETSKVQSTIKAMNSIAEDIVELNPDTIIVVTPHSIFNPYNFSIYTDELLSGSFINFGAPEVVIEHKNDKQLGQKIIEKAKNIECKMISMPEYTKLDHGTCVPLYFIDKAGFKGEICVMNYCALDKSMHINVGKIIKEAIEDSNKKVVFIASGDLSHRVIPTAPAGYDPNGLVFDKFVVSHIKDGKYEEIINIDAVLRERAGECAFNSLMTAFGVLDSHHKNNKVYSYEAPFGVGYIVATL